MNIEENAVANSSEWFDHPSLLHQQGSFINENLIGTLEAHSAHQQQRRHSTSRFMIPATAISMQDLERAPKAHFSVLWRKIALKVYNMKGAEQ